jgi:hypothetical protein
MLLRNTDKYEPRDWARGSQGLEQKLVICMNAIQNKDETKEKNIQNNRFYFWCS